MGNLKTDVSGNADGHDPKGVDVDEALIGEPQVGDHGQAEEAQLHERGGDRHAETTNRRDQRLESRSDLGRRSIVISPPIGRASSAITFPSWSTATWPPPSSASRRTAPAIAAGPRASRAPTTMTLWASWPTVEAKAPLEAETVHPAEADPPGAVVPLGHREARHLFLSGPTGR